MRRRRALISSSAQPWWQNSSYSQGASGSTPTANLVTFGRRETGQQIIKVKSPFYGPILEQEYLAYQIDIILPGAVVYISTNYFLHNDNGEGDYSLNDDCEDNHLYHEYAYCSSRVKYIAASIDFCCSRNYIYNLYICCKFISRSCRW
ncbi:hypothetical protein KCV04_g6548, partial [Aureobasidium melanogenum]